MNMVVVDVVGKLRNEQQIGLLMMPLKRRRRLLNKVSAKILRDSRKRVQKQTDLQGQPYKKRWKKRSDRRKMLSKLMKQSILFGNDGRTAKIGFKGLSGYIAAKQQFGFTETINLRSRTRRTLAGNQVTESNSARFAAMAFSPATKRQATELKALGFRIKEGKRSRTASLRWIMDNLTVARAGAIIRAMREKQGIRPNTTWNTVLPARSFLGATDQEVAQYIQDIFEDMKQEINHVPR